MLTSINTGSENTQTGIAKIWDESPGRSYLLERQYKETSLYMILHSQKATTMSRNMATSGREKQRMVEEYR
jgi:hypothetical protein